MGRRVELTTDNGIQHGEIMSKSACITSLILRGIALPSLIAIPALVEAQQPLKTGRYTCHTITTSANVTGTAAERMQDQNHREAGGTVRTVNSPGTLLAPAAFGAIILDGRGSYTMPSINQSGRYGFDRAKGVPTFTGDLGAMKLVEYSGSGDRFSLQWNGMNFHCGLSGAAAVPARAAAATPPGQAAPNADFIRSAGPRRASATAADFNGTYDGTYVCGSVTTVLRLRLRARADGAITGEVDFGGMRTPEISYSVGSYALMGSWSGTHFVLKADRWIKQPAGYVMVDIEGDLTTLGAAGKMLYSSCDSFAARRVE